VPSSFRVSQTLTYVGVFLLGPKIILSPDVCRHKMCYAGKACEAQRITLIAIRLEKPGAISSQVMPKLMHPTHTCCQAARSGYQVARSGYQVARSGYQVARSGYHKWPAVATRWPEVAMQQCASADGTHRSPAGMEMPLYSVHLP
jgi:hypothetical protein